jgi:molybdopterin-synthase adenylyltransferase
MSGERYCRQSFLGEKAEHIFATCIVGIVGLGGGGSHIAQQLAYLGFQQFVIYDPECIEESNLNRNIGGTESDVQIQQQKVAIAERLIRSVQPQAQVESFTTKWQENPLPLHQCDIIFGCVDGLKERRELETCARRFLIPYIDIGLDVHQVGDEPPIMAGQVLLSMPGEPCLICMGFLAESAFALEASLYGDAGRRPQVVWANGVLASTAIGLAVELLTGWTKHLSIPVYLVYRANESTVQSSARLPFLPKGTCSHYDPDQVGDVHLTALH